MNAHKLSRRDFLRLAGLSPLLFLPWIRQASASIKTAGARKATSGALPNILILVFDAWTARNISLYGYPRPTMPNLERLAERATVFHRHHSAGGFTSPGTASILTGVYPWTHRALQLYASTLPRFADQNLFSLLSERFHTFAYSQNILVNLLFYQQRAYIDRWHQISEASLYSDSPTQNHLQKDFGIAYEAERLMLRNGDFPSSSLFVEPFDWMKRTSVDKKLFRENQTAFPYGLPTIRDKGMLGFIYFTLEDTFSWLFERIKEQPTPFLGYVHLLPPHDPYNTRSEFAERFMTDWKPLHKPPHLFASGMLTDDLLDDYRRYYDEFVLYVDAEFARLYERLDQAGILENTILILTSDHGEMFERGIYQHLTRTLYEPQTHVPLLVFNPGQRERKDIDVTTNAVDLLPSLLEVAGLPVPEWCEGTALPGFSAQPPEAERSTFVVEAKENPKHGALNEATLAMYKGAYKMIQYLGYPGYQDSYELYNLEDDPEELSDIFHQAGALADEMKAQLEMHRLKANQGK
jgi:arylsulfatase A-like enzyme